MRTFQPTEYSPNHNSITAENGTYADVTFVTENDLRNNLLTLINKVVKHPVWDTRFKEKFEMVESLDQNGWVVEH
jgi:hypothetical protein